MRLSLPRVGPLSSLPSAGDSQTDFESQDSAAGSFLKPNTWFLPYSTKNCIVTTNALCSA